MKDQDRILQLDGEQEEVEKRQRLNSGSEAVNFIRRKKSLTHYDKLELLDSLPTVSPICDAAQIPSIAGTELQGPDDTKFSMDFLIGSGNQVKSYLTFAAASVPIIENEMPVKQLIPGEDLTGTNLRILKVMTLDQCLILNYTTTGSIQDIKTSVIMTQNKKLVI